jgi:16S rRNA (cytosine967-C5)-methyltransferase
MTPAARIDTVISLLGEIFASDRPADGVISAFFRNHRYIGGGDRRNITHRLYRILRHYHRLSAHLPAPEPRLFVIAEMALLSKEKPGDFFGEPDNKYAPAPLSEHEKQLYRMLEGQPIFTKGQPEHIALECPQWAADTLKKTLGDKFHAVMEAMLEEAPLDLRVNTLKTDRATLKAALEKALPRGIEETPYSPWGLRIAGRRPALGQMKLFQDGLFEIQDEGSQLIALAAAPKPGMRVLDICAGAGGKTLAMGALMENKGSITAADISEGRLKRAKQRFKRAGMFNTTLLPLSSENDKILKRKRGTFDIVLVDAPCTGTGTWRRDPDKKWRNIGPNLSSLLETQARILDSAAKQVKPGGKLVYATCSLLFEENEAQFAAFLEKHPDFTQTDLSKMPELAHIPLSGAAMRLLPSEHKTDGFFCAIAVRKEDAKEDKKDHKPE